jgi:fatty-acyl-CoA synthase
MKSPAITDRLSDLGAQDPMRPFCLHYSQARLEVITYGSLLDRASVVAGQLAVLQCEKGDVALLFVRHHPDLYAIFVGCMLQGTVPSLMPYPNPKQDSALFWKSHRELLARIQPRLLIVSASLEADFAENLPDFRDRICQAEGLTKGTPMAPEWFAINDVAFLQHSSGTTATKKGVMLSHQEVLAQVAAYQSAIGLNERDVVASWLPLYHDMGLISCFIMTLVTGATLVALDPFEWVGAPSSLLEIIERHRATFCWMPNFAFHHIANATRRGRVYDLSSIRAFINCSEPCKAESFELFVTRFAESEIQAHQLQVCYAMAENVFAVTQTSLSHPPYVLEVDRDAFEREGRAVPGQGLRLLSCGRAIDGVDIRISGDNGMPRPDGSVGEITIRSPFLFSGYYRQTEKTAHALRLGWYYTGDLGFLSEGELFVTGRNDDLLIAYGRNYYAHEVESIANTVSGLIPGRCVAFAVTSETAGTNHVILIAETYAAGDLTLVRRIKETVIGECGLAIHQVLLKEPGWLIKTTSGKISRGANRDRYLQSSMDRT